MKTGDKRKKENLRDSKLLKRYMEGDERAFGELTEIYRKELDVNNYKELGDWDDAQDATQDEFIILLNALRTGKFTDFSYFGGWMKKTAENHLKNVKKRRRLETVRMDVLPKEKAVVTDEDEVKEKISLMKRVMRSLPVNDMTLLWLKYWGKEQWGGIGNFLGIDENSASGRHSKVLRKVKMRMEKIILLKNGRIGGV